jgi:methyl-accepting chemotaxis protein
VWAIALWEITDESPLGTSPSGIQRRFYRGGGVVFLVFLLNTAGIRGGAEAARHIDDSHERLSQRPDRMLQLVLFSGVIGICAGVWVSRSLSAPLTQLACAAQAIGKRDFDRRVKVKGSQEIMT